MTSKGWRLVAREWERETGEEDAEPPGVEEIPYGTQVSAETDGLTENSGEMKVLTTALEMLVGDAPGQLGTAASVFDLLARLIPVGPQVMRSPGCARAQARPAGR